jgi:hypothetical protein
MLIGLAYPQLFDPVRARRGNTLAVLRSFFLALLTLLPIRLAEAPVCVGASPVTCTEIAGAAAAGKTIGGMSSSIALPAGLARPDTPYVRQKVVAEPNAAPSAYDAFRGLTVAEIEAFLREAPVVAIRDIRVGVTKPLRATLDDGRIRHDAEVQSVDVCEETPTPDGGGREITCDSYKYNIAAYEIGKLLGLTSIPPSVERTFNGRKSALTWWIDDALTLAEMEVRGLWHPNIAQWNREHPAIRIFDELISNTDRHMANLIQDPVWWVWMIDHTRAFGVGSRLRNPELLSKLPADSSLLVHLRELDGNALQRCCAAYLSAAERESVLVRRDSILALFD